MSYTHELETAIDAVRQAAKLCQIVQGTSSPAKIEKQDRSPVTIADFGSQALICRAIRDVFPDDPIIAEEDASVLRTADSTEILARVVDQVKRHDPDASSDEICRWIDYGATSDYTSRFWTLDPIDGTKGFLRGEQYAVALALIVDGEVAVAALACPNLPIEVDADRPCGALFSAIQGQGAKVSALNLDHAGLAIHVTHTTASREARFCESVESGHSAHGDSARLAKQLGIDRPPVRLDSQAKYAIVARGEADIYLRLPTRADYREKIWDHAPGMLVVEEAGGRVTDIHGKPLDFIHGAQLETNRGVIVTNGHLHDAVVETLADLRG